ncbi:major paralogous domain-containing protein [Mariniphaga anaerophila]|uniref:Major paralogous domain-containing protein n=1 Tax=Mariniphaga anaerophila TaxID=1484053 RepID=A0A1M5FE32_9BACT|nr:FISUMP domain-containing protein [Mariniphaga anaerophila]SHF89795.1 major paralogous domain-containing protein [Mariniphaga anaerophila]
MKFVVPFSIIFLFVVACAKTNGTFVDKRDGKEYQWIKIGDDIWMAENLAFLPSVDSAREASLEQKKYYVFGYAGDSADSAKTFQTYLWNDSLVVPYEKYGVMYNWAALVDDDTADGGSLRGVCPCGWHVPTDEEWMALEIALGMNPAEVEVIGQRNSGFLGYQLKANYGWDNNGNGIDSVSFKALPAGEVFGGVGFLHEGERSTFWTATPGLFGTTVWTRSVYCCEFGIVRVERDKMDGFSLRCVKD